MPLASLLFAVASRGATGTVALTAGSPPDERSRIELDGGWIHSLSMGVRRPPRGEDVLRELLRRPVVEVTFLVDDPPRRSGRVTPFHPAVVIRNHVEGGLGADAASSLRSRFASRRIRLLYPPHASCLGSDERPLVTLLGVARPLADLDQARLTPLPRVDRLLAFLEAVGCVVVEPEEPTPFELLGVAEGAPAEEVRRAFKRIARTLHPDLQPHLSDAQRRELEARFATLTVAYKRILPSG